MNLFMIDIPEIISNYNNGLLSSIFEKQLLPLHENLLHCFVDLDDEMSCVIGKRIPSRCNLNQLSKLLKHY